jgi:hypothetical protein
MPRSRNWWVKSSINSRSMKSRKVSCASTKVTATSSALKIVAYSMPITPAPTTVRLRGNGRFRRSRRCRARCVRRTERRPADVASCRRRAGSARREHPWTFALGQHLDMVRIEEAGHAGNGAHPVAGELMLQHIDLMIEGHVQPHHQVLGLDVLLDPVGAAVKPAFPPAGQVQHRLAQGLRRDGAGVDRYAADLRPFSMTRTDLPSLAAWMAARRPAGPLPMMMKSWLPSTTRSAKAPLVILGDPRLKGEFWFRSLRTVWACGRLAAGCVDCPLSRRRGQSRQVLRQPPLHHSGGSARHRHFRETLELAAKRDPGHFAVAINFHRRLHPARIIHRAGADHHDALQHIGGASDRGAAVRAESGMRPLTSIALAVINLDVTRHCQCRRRDRDDKRKMMCR